MLSKQAYLDAVREELIRDYLPPSGKTGSEIGDVVIRACKQCYNDDVPPSIVVVMIANELGCRVRVIH